MKQALEVRAIEGIRSKKWIFVTFPISWLFTQIIRLRHWLYDKGWIGQKHAPLPVVSVGNLVVGGVGKTQVVLLLAKKLEDVAILSRGFRGKAEKRKEPLVVSTHQHLPSECGDEPWLLASRLPKAQVIVNRDRYLSSLKAKKLGARVLILDDGMQHRRLFRDIEIVVLEGKDPLGGGRFLPSGLLREDPKRLAKADLVIFMGQPSKTDLEKVMGLAQSPYATAQIKISGIYDLKGEGFPSIKGKKIGLFCGIGNPERFVSSVEALGAVVVATKYLADHKKIQAEELKRFASFCKEKGAQYLLCTEKDKVKLPEILLMPPLLLGWVKVDLEIIKNQEAWDRITKEITILAGLIR